MNDWTPEKQQISMAKPVAKLVSDLAKDKITFIESCGHKDNNVAFIQGDKMVMMSKHSFYRYSGLAVMVQADDKKEHRSKIIVVTDDMWLQNYIKPIVYTRLAAGGD